MKFGLDLPPQQRVYAGFFVYSFCKGSLPPRLPDLQRMIHMGQHTKRQYFVNGILSFREMSPSSSGGFSQLGVELHGRSHEWLEFHLHEKVSLLLRRSLVLCPAHHRPNDRDDPCDLRRGTRGRGGQARRPGHGLQSRYDRPPFSPIVRWRRIEVESNSPDDDTSKVAIRRHMQKIAGMFGQGDLRSGFFRIPLGK